MVKFKLFVIGRRPQARAFLSGKEGTWVVRDEGVRNKLLGTGRTAAKAWEQAAKNLMFAEGVARRAPSEVR